MFQLHFERGNEKEFREFDETTAEKLHGNHDSKVLFHIYNDTAQRAKTNDLTAILRELMPQASFVGCSTSGNICNGTLVNGELPNITAICSVFENKETMVEVHQFPLDRNNRVETAQAFIKLVEERPWVKAVELVTTLVDVGMSDFCDDLSMVRDDIEIFGGAALSSETINMWAGLPYVFSSAGTTDNHGIVFVLYGGEGVHVCTQTIFGWKPLGRTLTITSSEGPVLKELDGEPAFARFHHYLSLEDDDQFSKNSIIFPIAVQHEGRMVIKAPVKVGENGEITLTSDLARYHKKCRIAYGDPGTILRSIKESARNIQEFDPQGILAYSCAARRMYWGDENISRETLPLQGIAQTAGFYTGGEFSRDRGKLLHHNVTLVVAAMREGEKSDTPKGEIVINETEFTRQMGIVNSLAALVGVTSAELEDAYFKMQIMAKTDGLTGLCNRREIQDRIQKSIDECESDPDIELPSIIMLDIDDFKSVNDSYGHKAGDEVLKELGSLLRTVIDDAQRGSSGRWGGEEFMLLLPRTSVDQARLIAQLIRNSFAEKHFEQSGNHTVSIGVAQAMSGESLDLLCQRADKALYAAKRNGKNRVVLA